MKTLDASQLIDVVSACNYLLGCELVRKLPSGEALRARIVETEGYHQEDPASHTFSGRSARNNAMFGPAGHAYIYFTYGMHWCFNVTAGPNGYGAGVLIRAVEPLQGAKTMLLNRKVTDTKQLTNGPAKLAQALMIDKKLYGHDLTQPPLQIFEPKNRDFQVIETTRIGISKATEEIARFYIRDNSYVSRHKALVV